MKKIITILIMTLLLCGCGKSNNEKMKELMAENEYIIVDVRTKEEYSSGHIKDAINIPYDEINEETELDKTKLIFVYCKSGNRSKYAYEILKNLGYETYDLGAYEDIDLEKE